MSEIKQGDVVVLKSGGPKMTVEKVGNFSTAKGIPDGAMCVWFEGNEARRDVFDRGILKKEEG